MPKLCNGIWTKFPMTDADRSFLPYARQSIDEGDIAAVAAVLRGDWLTTGPKVKAFEETFAAKVGARFAVSCSSGTAGLHLASLALALGEGDAIVMPALTFLATANAARYVGAEVIFAGVDPDSGLMGAADLNAALEGAADKGAKAVFPVHLNGQCRDMEAIAALAAERGLKVVEDACHALGTTYRTDRGETVSVGSCRHGDIAVFSFHPVKIIAMGEGGAVTTNDEALYERLVKLRNHGITHDANAFENAELAFDGDGSANPWYYEMPELGFNYRASDINCALGLSQLGKLDHFVSRRRALAARYDDLLAPLAPLVRPVSRVADCEPAWHLYVVLIDFTTAGISRAVLMQRLRDEGIGTQVHYIPVYEQPYYRRRYGRQSLPGAEAYYARALSLPLFPAMSEADVERVVGALRGHLGN